MVGQLAGELVAGTPPGVGDPVRRDQRPGVDERLGDRHPEPPGQVVVAGPGLPQRGGPGGGPKRPGRRHVGQRGQRLQG
ncbi:MAG: hypothetical protein J2P26_12005, partial [Nocardiopsaceae bacterium]|nr:hypothetical protein [Nocardiopsaceae bacterium]